MTTTGDDRPTSSNTPGPESRPQPVVIADTIPPARDIAFLGEIRLAVDATDTVHGIFGVTETIPVATGPLTLLYPKWIPGDHAPAGPIGRIAGLVITGADKPLAWRRDPIDIYAFHIEVPAGISSIEVRFQYLSPTCSDQGLVVITGGMLLLQWHTLTLYPAGYFVRNILVAPTVTFPPGWTSATALSRAGAWTACEEVISYDLVSLDTLIDSPVMAGVNARVVPLEADVTLNIFADKPDQLAATPEQIDCLRTMVQQAVTLFGARHYDHYDILLGLSDALSAQGLEHHRSSEQVVAGDFFTGSHTGLALFDLLAHEFAHSWNGKFRRPAELWTPDYSTPMQNGLLWVYEGQTVFWDSVLSVRSGAISKVDALDVLAGAAALQAAQGGRAWRPLADTNQDPLISTRGPAPWTNWQRAGDYYSEGQLIWLDVDSVIREQSAGTRSMDDFARIFFGAHDRDWGVVTYTFDDVVTALNQVSPYEWAEFFHVRVDAIAPSPPLGWLTRYGYRLVYSDEPGRVWVAREAWRKVTDLSLSLGLIIGGDGLVKRVLWESPAYAAGINVGAKVLAVGDRSYSEDGLKRAICGAKGGGHPLSLLIEQGDIHRTVELHWNGGLRYPHLERVGEEQTGLDLLYSPRVIVGSAAVPPASPFSRGVTR